MTKNQKNSSDRVIFNFTPTRLGQFIQNERKRRQLTQSELASLAGVGLNFVSQIENGKDTAQIGKVLHILKILGFEIHIKART